MKREEGTKPPGGRTEVSSLPTPSSSTSQGHSHLALTYLFSLFPHPHRPGLFPIFWFAFPGLPPPRVPFTIVLDQDLVAMHLLLEDW